MAEDLPVPGKPYTFGRLQAAQAGGDRQALAGRHRPLLHLHLTDRAKGIAQLLVSIFTCGLGSLWPFIDGIIILATDSVDSNGYPLKS